MNTTKEDMNNFVGNFPSSTFADGTCLIIGAMAIVGVVDTDDGLVLFDVGTEMSGPRIFQELRKFSDKPVKYIITELEKLNCKF